MRRYTIWSLLFLLAFCTLFEEAKAGKLLNLPMLELTTPIHFLTLGKDDVALPAGNYHVEVAESWLKLVPEGEVRSAMVLIEATQGSHEEHLTEAIVRAEPDDIDPDIFHLAVLLPDGTGWETIGSSSGIRTRSSKLAFLQRSDLNSTRQPALKALQLSGQDPEVTQEIVRLQKLMKQGAQAVPDKQTVSSAQTQQRDRALVQDLLELRKLLGK